MNFTGCSVLILDKSTKKLNVSKVTKEVRRVFGFQSSKIHLRILNSFKFKNTYGLLALPGFLSVWLNRDGFKHILSICLNSGWDILTLHLLVQSKANIYMYILGKCWTVFFSAVVFSSFKKCILPFLIYGNIYFLFMFTDFLSLQVISNKGLLMEWMFCCYINF